MAGKPLTKEQQLAEAIKFQNEVSRATDRRSSRAPSRGGSRSPNMTDPSYNMTSSGLGVTGTPRGNSRQATPQKLATPEQLFGRPSPVPTSVFQNTPTPVTQQPASKLADHFDPMQVDSRSGVPQETRSVNSTTPVGGRSLGSSRWATSGSVKPVSDVKAVDGSEFMDVGQDSLTPKLIQADPSPESLLKASKSSEASPVPDSSTNTSRISSTASTQEAIIKNADNSGSSMNKGLYGSRWAASASKNESHSSLAPQYPDPSTLEPVYRSSDWLSDLTAEYKALSIKKKGAAEAQSAQASSTIQSNDVQSAARTVGPPSSGATVQSGKITVKLPPHSAEVEPTVQTSCNPAAFDAPSQGPAFGQHPTPQLTRTSRGAADLRMPSVQRPNTNVSPAVEPSRAPAFAQPVDKKPLTPPANTSSASPFNDVAFKDWYNTQFMSRKA